MNRIHQVTAALVAAIVLPGPAAAQEAAPTTPPPADTVSTDAAPTAPSADWDMVRDPPKNMVAAYVSLDSGVSIVLRCANGVYDALVSGLPDAPMGDTRVLRLSYNDNFSAETWNVATRRSTALSAMPAPFARKLRKGGMVSIIIPDGAGPGRNLRHNLLLPQSSTAVDETLTACGRPLVDPRDAALSDLGENALSSAPSWAQAPRPSYPFPPLYAKGFAVLSCMALPDGRLDACIVESEFPIDGGFGNQALKSTRDARFNTPDGSPRLLVFRTNFRMEDSAPSGPRLGRLGRDE